MLKWNFQNLNKYLKNHTHVKKVGHTSEFLFGIYWWTEKLFKKLFEKLFKKLLRWANKKQIILIFAMLHLKKKTKTKHTCRYHYQNLDGMICSSWDIEQNKLKLVILGHFLPFIPLKIPKIKILKKEKIWCTVPEIRTHFFSHFGPFFTLVPLP